MLSCLEGLEDPRIERKRLYPLKEILLIALCAMFSGFEGFRPFEMYGEEKLELLRKIYPYENGIPSHDTFARVFSLLCPKQFCLLLEEWSQGLRVLLSEDDNHIAFDGKTLRGSRGGEDKQSALHVVSAFCSQTRLVLTQEKAKSKGYAENDAILKMLERLDMKGATVSIDAIGCQLKMAQAIKEAKADYVLGLKRNQGDLLETVQNHFSSGKATLACDETVDKGHGRLEVRRCWVSTDLRDLTQAQHWVGLKSLVCLESERTIKGKISKETRYFLSSLNRDAATHNRIIRRHWAIENQLHWVLDVTFSEDNSRVRTKNAPENMSILRKMCANLLQKLKTPDNSLKGLRMRAALNDQVLISYITNF